MPKALDPVLDLYMRDVGRYDLLSKEEELETANRVKAGDKQAAEHMVNCNLRLVIHIAKKYSRMGYPLDDLIAAGNMGLIKSVGRFDPDKGYRFSTYATWWIKQTIRKHLSDKTRTIRIPSYQLSGPNAEEVKARTACTSFETLIGVDIEDSYEKCGGFEDAQMLRELLDSLDKRKRFIIEMRYGMRQGIVFTLDKVGETLKLSRERVRQLQKEALVEMRELASKLACVGPGKTLD